MNEKILVSCWADNNDQNFIDRAFGDKWETRFVNDLETLEYELSCGNICIALVKLEKGNVLNIINNKAKLKKLQKAFGIPVCFLVKYENNVMESNYQILLVDDTEIFTVNSKNIEKTITAIIAEKTAIIKLLYNDRSHYLDGRSYNFAM